MRQITGAKKTDEISQIEKKNRKLAYDVAKEGIVLLENDGTLPLKQRSVALFGAGAIKTIKGGTGSGEVNERYSVSIFDGLINAGITVENKSWLKDYDNEFIDAQETYHKQKFDINNILRSMEYPCGRLINRRDLDECQKDVAIYVVARQAGEGKDKRLEDFSLNDIEKTNIKYLSKYFKKVILIINSGSIMDISFIDKLRLNAVIYYSEQGMEGGNALADILIGKTNPSGKLVDSWVNKYEDIPFANEFSYLKGNDNNEYYKEGIYVGYRYFSTFNKPLRYSFGYGLSYTNFEIEYLNTKFQNEKFTISLKVKNIGKYSGKEVVQVYARNNLDNHELKRLVGFGKTKELNPNESCALSIHFNIKDLSSYDEQRAVYYVDQGSYILEIGNSLSKTKDEVAVVVEEEIILENCRNLCSANEPIANLEIKKTRKENITKLDKININSKMIASLDHHYMEDDEIYDRDVKTILSKLSLKDKIDLCVGSSYISMFSSKGIVCPGSAGRTTDKLFSKGLINVNLCDGPAGLRVMKTSSIGKNLVKMLDSSISVINSLPKWLVKPVLADKSKDQISYQFCTAFPVETALAQTWNTDLVENVGKAISLEMKEYYVTYWLAPAMNIHRNPLGARNFEYFSEDPLLTGKMAAALVNGIQSIEGNYATIKHFACNNQEDNRKYSNSIVDERTLREIYLRGFEIAVRESNPAALMTSYNLINGIYSPNNKDLLNGILFNEWEFNGVVMTDWDSCSKGCGDPAKAINVGNYMIMPGSNRDKRIIKKAIRKGELNKRKLDIACEHIIKQIISSQVYREHSDKLLKTSHH